MGHVVKKLWSSVFQKEEIFLKEIYRVHAQNRLLINIQASQFWEMASTRRFGAIRTSVPRLLMNGNEFVNECSKNKRF